MRRYRRLNDVQLLEAARLDGEAFGVFYDRHADTVLAFVRRRVGAPQVAVDVTSETFARALQALPAYQQRDDVPPVGWLLTIARNLIIDAHRRGRVSDAARAALGMRAVDLTDGDLQRVDERCSVDASSERLEAVLAELPADQRDAILAHVVDEAPYRQIAAEIGCSESVVRQRVSRGLRSLRSQLREDNS